MQSGKFHGAILLLSMVWASQPAAQAQTRYWPLRENQRWELRSPSVPQPMIFEVEGRDGDEYRVRWDNPWVRATFYFRMSGNRILLSRLDMGAGVAEMPPETVYFDFDQRQGGSWTSQAGTMTVTARSRTVRTPAGEYRDCITIRAKGSDGGETFWTFAPDVGVVQFGEGRSAFLLTEVALRSGGEPRGEPVAGADRRTHRLLVGIDCNPPPNEGFSPAAINKRFQMCVSAGMSFTKIHPKWNEVEPNPGRYNFAEVESHSARAAAHQIPIYLGIRTIDTQGRSMPAAYSGWKWDDPRMTAKLTALLEAMAAKMRGNVRWVAIGNEVDQYFKSRGGEIGPYATLLKNITPVVRRLWPGAAVTVNFTWEAAHEMARYRPITDRMEVFSFTYYPLNSDFTVRSPSQIEGHIKTLVQAAAGRPLILQELGYPSGSANRSSEDLQAQFVERSLRAAQSYGDKIIAINYLWMSDLPDSVVEEFAKYYQLPNAEKFKSYLATMGMFDKNGRPKKAWSVFQNLAGR
ncbi:MAG TPA: hypothetical protein VNN17_12740 [Terriglobia bacterium]|nr:hypothetical protein [Terriglobia bacterium]